MALSISQLVAALGLTAGDLLELVQDNGGTLESRKVNLGTLKSWLQFKNNLTATADPGVNDDSAAGYEAGSKWLNTNTDEWFICSVATAGAAVWEPLSLSADDLGTAAIVNTGTGAGDVPLNSDLGTSAYADLAAGGGTVPETDRDNDFFGSVHVLGAGSRLGVGVSSPEQDLHVLNGSTAAAILCERSGGHWVRMSSGTAGSAIKFRNSGPFSFGPVASKGDTDLVDTFVVTQDKKIGFGTSSPGADVDVAGTFRCGMYTVGTLPSSPSEGVRAYATDGLKSGETAGNGTGVPVYYSNGSWRVYSNDTAVAS